MNRSVGVVVAIAVVLAVVVGLWSRPFTEAEVSDAVAPSPSEAPAVAGASARPTDPKTEIARAVRGGAKVGASAPRQPSTNKKAVAVQRLEDELRPRFELAVEQAMDELSAAGEWPAGTREEATVLVHDAFDAAWAVKRAVAHGELDESEAIANYKEAHGDYRQALSELVGDDAAQELIRRSEAATGDF